MINPPEGRENPSPRHHPLFDLPNPSKTIADHPPGPPPSPSTHITHPHPPPIHPNANPNPGTGAEQHRQKKAARIQATGREAPRAGVIGPRRGSRRCGAGGIEAEFDRMRGRALARCHWGREIYRLMPEEVGDFQYRICPMPMSFLPDATHALGVKAESDVVPSTMFGQRKQSGVQDGSRNTSMQQVGELVCQRCGSQI